MKSNSVLLIATALLLLLSSCDKTGKFECAVSTVTEPESDSAILFVPNVFSPNGDGLNDRFGPLHNNKIVSINWKVFNTKNEELFATADMNTYWSPAMSFEKGMTLFHYQVTAVTADGNTISQCGNFYAYTCVPKDFSMDNVAFGDQFDPTLPKGYLHGVTNENFEACD